MTDHSLDGVVAALLGRAHQLAGDRGTGVLGFGSNAGCGPFCGRGEHECALRGG